MARGKYEPNRDEQSPAAHGVQESLIKSNDHRSSPKIKLTKEEEIHELAPLQGAAATADEDDVKVTSRAPDGGYGWVIVIAAFFCSFVVDGVAYSISVFQSEWEEQWPHETKGRVAIIGSLLNAFYLCMGPISTALTNAFGFRKVIFAGAVVTALSFIASAFATSVDFLIVTFGVCGGIGFGLIYSPSILCVCYYFEKKRAMAVGICVCGSGVGALVCPPLVKMIVNGYGWDGAMFFLAGGALQACVAGALMRTLEVEVTEDIQVQSTDAAQPLSDRSDRKHPLSLEERALSEGSGPSNFRGGASRSRHASDSTEPGEVEIVKSRKYRSSHGVDVTTMDDGRVRRESTSEHTRYFSTPDISEDGTRVRRKSVKEMSHPLDRADALVQGSLKHIPQGDREIAEADAFLRRSQQSLYRRQQAARAEETHMPVKKSWLPESLRVALVEMTDLSIYKNWIFLVFSAASFMGMVAFYVPFFFIPGFAFETLGIARDDSYYMISTIGGANIVGRIFWGWLVDRPSIDPLIVHNLCVITVGVILGFVPICQGFVSLMSICVGLGFFMAPFISLLSIILTSRIGLKQLPSAFGQSQFVRGIASAVGPPLGGALFDINGNYSLTMYAGALEFVLASAIASIILVVEFMRRRQKAPTRSVVA